VIWWMRGAGVSTLSTTFLLLIPCTCGRMGSSFPSRADLTCRPAGPLGTQRRTYYGRLDMFFLVGLGHFNRELVGQDIHLAIRWLAASPTVTGSLSVSIFGMCVFVCTGCAFHTRRRMLRFRRLGQNGATCPTFHEPS